MIFDHRTYTLKPGTIKAHLEIYEKFGFGPQSKHLGKPVLYATTERARRLHGSLLLYACVVRRAAREHQARNDAGKAGGQENWRGESDCT